MGFDLTESPARLASYLEENGDPWEGYLGDREIIMAYRVLSQATKVGVDDEGVIRLQNGYSAQRPGWWVDVFERLVATIE